MTTTQTTKQKIILICGHYGSGKTNLAINLALASAKTGQKTALVDLDVVNPYFRSSDYRPLLENAGVRVISPCYAATNLDLPSLPADIFSVFCGDEKVFFDVGGDPEGATALGRFHREIKAAGYELLYVINRYRALTATAAEAAALLPEIEAASHLQACAVVNNSHLMHETTAQLIDDAHSFATDTADLLHLPLRFTTAPRRCADQCHTENLLPIDIYVNTPWDAP